MYHRFGYTRARFFLLPLYADTTIDEQTTYTVLWPVFSYSQGHLLRGFPSYGWKKSDDTTSQYFLWPFIQDSCGPDNHKMDAVLPLFRYDRGPTYRNISILWPFFNYNRDDEAHHMSMDFPWPLLRIASGAYEEVKIFPFYWTNTDGKTYSKKHILWPLWSKRSWHDEDTGTDEETGHHTPHGLVYKQDGLRWTDIQEGDPLAVPIHLPGRGGTASGTFPSSSPSFSMMDFHGYGARFSVLPKAPRMGHHPR